MWLFRMVSLNSNDKFNRRVFGLIAISGVLLLLSLFSRLVVEPEVQAVRHAEIRTVAAINDQSPSMEAGGGLTATLDRQGNPQSESIKLPYFENRNLPTGLKQIFYTITLDEKNLVEHHALLDMDAIKLENKYGLLFVQIINGGDFYLNGHWVAGLPASTTTARWMWYQPFIVPLPSRLLKTDGTPNTLTVSQTTLEPYISISRLYFGNLDELLRIDSVVNFVSSTLANAFEVLCFAAGLFLVSIWLVAPKERMFAFAGGICMIWALLFVILQLQYIPTEAMELRRWSVYMCEGALLFAITFFILWQTNRTFGLSARCTFFGLLGIAAALCAVGGSADQYDRDVIWAAAALMLYASVTLLLFAYWWKTRRAPVAFFLAEAVLFLMLMLHDYAMRLRLTDHLTDVGLEVGWSGLLFEHIFLLHLAVPGLLLSVGYMLITRHQENVTELGRSQFVLERRETELEEFFHQRGVLEISAATLVERERIYQDIHDGIGSQLVKAIFTLRSAGTTSSAVVDNLRACLQDLRLVIDAEPECNVDIQTTVFAFCVTQEQHLEGSGLDIRYDVGTGSTVYANPKVSLNVLRVLQESLGNALKYSGATVVDIKLNLSESCLTLCITDNGHGHELPAHRLKEHQSAYGASGKRGVTGLALRAADIGAKYTMDITETGTKVCFTIPIIDSVTINAESKPA